MLKGVLRQKTRLILPPNGLKAGYGCKIKNDVGEIVDEFQILSYWVAEIHFYEYFEEGFSGVRHMGELNFITVSVFKTDKGNKGVLLCSAAKKRDKIKPGLREDSVLPG